MKTFRKILFWIHLATGLIAGLAIAIMCFTGVLLAFEQELVAWAERDVRRVEPVPGVRPLPLATLQERVNADRPDLRSPTITLRADPAAAVAFSAGRDDAVYVNPYTGEIREPASARMHDFMRVMVAWHRFLGREGDSRPLGKAVNGACNLAFLALAVSGLYLWWPRHLSWRSVKAVAIFNGRLAGKARDFNWHNSIGLWCAPILIVLTLTAVPISYRWGNDLVYRLVGEEPPARGRPAATGSPEFEISPLSPDAEPLSLDAIVANTQAQFPRWQQITVRTGGGPVRGPAAAAAGNPATAANPNSPSPLPNPPALSVIVRAAGSWPRTATTTLTVHPFTGDVLESEGHADLSTGAQIRRWTRFLHTGQALGWGGQLVAGVACLGGLFLVYTGFALSWRRFFGQRPRATTVRVETRPASETAATMR